VKDALAKPNDKATQQKLSDALATARTQMAGATAALTPAHIRHITPKLQNSHLLFHDFLLNIQPADNVSATAQAMKKEIAELRAAI